ncbi:MAG TPA: septum formation initiator [Firmicutes bacterium]|jgi:cell division initiation protein|nr:septum formation initiator [Bacillota bacterium]
MLTPVDLESTVFRRGFRGYNASEVQEFMENFSHDYEKLYRENIDLKEQLEESEKKLHQYQLIEDSLRNAMVLAEETAEEAKANAIQKAEQIVREAELNAEAVKMKAKEDIQTEIRNLALLKNQVEYFKCQFKSFLGGLLEMAEKQLDLNVAWNQSPVGTSDPQKETELKAIEK